MDPIQILQGGSLGIFDDLINFWEEFIENKMADRGCFKIMAPQKLMGRISYKPLVGSHSNFMWWFSGYF